VLAVNDDQEIFRTGFSRRGFLTATAATGVGAALAGAAPAAAASGDKGSALPTTVGPPLTTPVVNGLHLQFGADASSEVTVSWHTLQPVNRARVILGELDGSYRKSQNAEQTSYKDGKSGQVVYAYHAKLTALNSSHHYVYAAIHDGAQPEFGSFRTGPRGREAFTFTSFGDQGTPTLGKKYVPPAGVTIANPEPVNGVETVQAACSVSCSASSFSWGGSLIQAASGSWGGVGARRNRVGLAA
jgi:hypothetical protein